MKTHEHTSATRVAEAHTSMIDAPFSLLNASVVSLGAAALVAPLMKRLQRRKPLTIVALGSSITARHGGCTHSLAGATACDPLAPRSRGWLRLFFDGINASYPNPHHKLHNAGMHFRN